MQQDNSTTSIQAGRHLLEAGRFAEAREQFEAACRQDPANATAWLLLGSTDIDLGNPDAAEPSLSRALELDPGLAQAHYRLAVLQQYRGQFDAAIESVERALALAPADRGTIGLAITLYTMAGQSHAQRGEIEQSGQAFRRLLELKPDSADARYGLAFADYRLGRLEQAAAGFARTLELNPGHVEAGNALGTVYQEMGRYEQALQTYERTLAISPNHIGALFGKASALMELARHQEAIDILRRIIELNPGFAPAHINLASALMTFSKPEEALQCCERALALQPHNIDAQALAARIEQHSGHPDEAYRRLSGLLEKHSGNANIAVAYGEVCRSLDRPDEAIARLESLLTGAAGLPVTSRRNLHFCLGSLYDKTRNHARAFSHYQAGNDLRPTGWNPDTQRANTDETIRVFSRDFLAGAPRSTLPTNRPVFVLGMPRSGTSLVEQILASHPAVHGAGELPILMRIAYNLPAFLGTTEGFPACVTRLEADTVNRIATHYLNHLEKLSPDARHVVDKMPGNYQFLGLIDLLFPDARVIHCVRDPVDTCLSCYFQDFSRTQDYTYDLTHLGLFYRDYARLMQHWKSVLRVPVLDVSYEALVADQEAVSRAMIGFCGLDWDERCLDFHRTRRFVATASYDQVRRPIYTSSTRRREQYRAFIEPLLEALGPLA